MPHRVGALADPVAEGLALLPAVQEGLLQGRQAALQAAVGFTNIFTF